MPRRTCGHQTRNGGECQKVPSSRGGKYCQQHRNKGRVKPTKVRWDDSTRSSPDLDAFHAPPPFDVFEDPIHEDDPPVARLSKPVEEMSTAPRVRRALTKIGHSTPTRKIDTIPEAIGQPQPIATSSKYPTTPTKSAVRNLKSPLVAGVPGTPGRALQPVQEYLKGNYCQCSKPQPDKNTNICQRSKSELEVCRRCETNTSSSAECNKYIKRNQYRDPGKNILI